MGQSRQRQTTQHHTRCMHVIGHAQEIKRHAISEDVRIRSTSNIYTCGWVTISDAGNKIGLPMEPTKAVLTGHGRVNHHVVTGDKRFFEIVLALPFRARYTV